MGRVGFNGQREHQIKGRGRVLFQGHRRHKIFGQRQVFVGKSNPNLEEMAGFFRGHRSHKISWQGQVFVDGHVCLLFLRIFEVSGQLVF